MPNAILEISHISCSKTIIFQVSVSLQSLPQMQRMDYTQFLVMLSCIRLDLVETYAQNAIEYHPDVVQFNLMAKSCFER